MNDEFFGSELEQLRNISNSARGVARAILTDQQNAAVFGADGGGGMNDGNSINEQVRQMGLQQLEQLMNGNRDVNRFDLFNAFAADSATRSADSLPPRPDRRNQTIPRNQATQDAFSMFRGLNDNQQDILQRINELRGSVMGQGQIDPNIGIEAGMSQLTNLIAGGAAMGLSLATGMPDSASSAIIDSMRRYGVDEAMINTINDAMDTNKDGTVSTFEAQSLLNDTAMIEKLSSMDATTRKMLRDPDFRVRVIQRKPVTSIYGEDPFARFNQVELVEQGIANDGASANQFNVSF
jgi:hypothetical protein